MQLITIDFETYYDKRTFSLSKLTTEEYVRSPLFEVIGVAVKVDEGETHWCSGDKDEIYEFLDLFHWENSMVLCQNTAFDAAILEWHFDLHPMAYADTMSMGQALFGINKSVSLKNMAIQFGIGEKGTEVDDASGKRRADFSKRELSSYGEYCRNDVELTHKLFKLMLPRFTLKELKLIDCTIKMFARPKFSLDVSYLEQHLADVQNKKQKLLESPLCDPEILQSNPKFAALLESFGVAPPMKVSATTGKETYAFAKTDEAFKELLEHEDERVQTVVAARLGTKSSIEETRTERFIAIGERGLLPIPLKYSGAAVTHRWSGFDKINLQNLPRGGALRKAIKAPKGHVVLAGDLSNIELRLGMWLAKQNDAVKKIADGVDMYRDFAAQAFNLNYSDIPKDSDTRFIAKVCCLSLIYGTGSEKLMNTIRIQSGGKTTVELKEAERLKNTYRETYQWVVDAWDQGKHVLDCILHGHRMGFLRDDIIQVTPEGLLKPSGLILAYPDLRKSRTESGWMYDYAQKGKLRDKVYGSKVYQRCTQSLARDIIGDMVLELDSLFGVALQVHDEIVCIVPEAEAETAMTKMIEVMSTPQGWYADLPLAAEAGFGASYGDAK